MESSTPFRDASNVESMPKGHCHWITNEIKPGLKIKIQIKLSELSSLYPSLQTNSKTTKKPSKTKKPVDLWDSAVWGRQDYLPKQTELVQNNSNIWTCSTLMVTTISIWIFMLYKHSFAVIVLLFAYQLFPLKTSFPCYRQQHISNFL